MTIILAPGVAQLKILGHIQGIPWNSIVYFSQGSTGVWTSPQLTAAGDAILSGMAAQINSSSFQSALTWDQVQGVDLGQTAPALGNSTHAALAGTSSNEMTASNCILINYGIGARYRGGKPRTYLPGFISLQQANPNTWLATTFNNFLTAWKNTMQAVTVAVTGAGAAACAQCVPTYNYTYTDVPGKHKYTKQRTSYKQTYLIGSTTGTPTIRTQRRRLG